MNKKCVNLEWHMLHDVGLHHLVFQVTQTAEVGEGFLTLLCNL